MADESFGIVYSGEKELLCSTCKYGRTACAKSLTFLYLMCCNNNPANKFQPLCILKMVKVTTLEVKNSSYYIRLITT